MRTAPVRARDNQKPTSGDVSTVLLFEFPTDLGRKEPGERPRSFVRMTLYLCVFLGPFSPEEKNTKHSNVTSALFQGSRSQHPWIGPEARGIPFRC